MRTDRFEALVQRANLAPSVHNTQPARWRLGECVIELFCDRRVTLGAADAEGRDAAFSCGAAVEATVLALSEEGIGARVETADWRAPGDRGLALMARITPGGAVSPDALAGALPARFTHRGPFAEAGPCHWSPGDAVLVTDPEGKARIAALNDAVSLEALREGAARRELLSWMRLSERHPRFGLDGMSRDALRMAPFEARAARLALGPFWPVLDLLGLTSGLTAEAAATQSATAIAGFHRPRGESPVDSGRAYLRLWLEATQQGYAGWPMAALTDDAPMQARLHADLALPPDRELLQMIRFGPAGEDPPPRARRPLDEIIV